MVIHTYGHSRTYEPEALLKLFRPAEKFEFSTEPEPPAEGEYFSAVLLPEGDARHLICGVRIGGETRSSDKMLPPDTPNNILDREISGLLYPLLCELTGIRPQWGMLTGIRPVNLLRKFAVRTGSLRQAEDDFRNIWHVTDEKTRLASEILSVQQPIIDAAPENSVSIYLSVPFCPTRCKYCSFVSNSVSQMGNLIDKYYMCIAKEIDMVGDLVLEYGLTVDTIYIGGGTPTSIDLYQPLDWLHRNFAVNQPLREYTIEAGRPDTITRESIGFFRQFGVTRISVNPQSFQDDVLKAAGRPHTAQDAVDKFLLARELGFDNINMAFIAGLPCDTVKGFRESIDRAVALEPESITVHCLALKKAADFYQSLPMPEPEAVSEMVAYAQKTLKNAGYRPYYLYRQKNMAANLENVGYAKPGFESAYNVMMMDDSQTVLGIGAGASTKVLGGKRGIERLTECKYPYDYLARFDELMKDKEQQLRELLDSQRRQKNG
ncbi:MAG: coproporphyrinogen dehydrogenase HemZ [Oscillospiraceae bacterium]|nr:coproporphyrinogen dehydrogenase HemZ [Oscillospiraceae bacterium]